MDNLDELAVVEHRMNSFLPPQEYRSLFLAKYEKILWYSTMSRWTRVCNYPVGTIYRSSYMYPECMEPLVLDGNHALDGHYIKILDFDEVTGKIGLAGSLADDETSAKFIVGFV
jgi:hypothetical protein